MHTDSPNDAERQTPPPEPAVTRRAGAHAPQDLTACDREPIHIPGSIQAHGVLLAVSEPDLVLAQVSASTAEHLGQPPAALLGRPLQVLLGEEAVARVRAALALPSFRRVNPLPLVAGGRAWDAVLSRSGGLLLLELEPAGDEEPGRDVAEDVREALFRLQATDSTAELLEVAADELRRLTGFDRVMVYRFDPDWHGKVVAESRSARPPESFLGMHFPSSDIPAQARRLYTLNLTRLFGDVRRAPSPLVPRDNPLTGRPLDLSHATLRSVSPVHTEYLSNMGVVASMSVSLVHDEQLWGLIACHHYEARWVSPRVRRACEFLGQGLSWLLASKERAEEAADRLRTRGVLETLTARMAGEGELLGTLAGGTPSVLEVVDAAGAAVLYEGECALVGRTPPRAEVEALAGWLREHMEEGCWSTESLAAAYPGGERLTPVASGVLATAFSRAHGNFVLWFRPEVRRTVPWGGDPNKRAQPGPDGRLHPRGSFALWEEELRGRAQPWRPWELEAADALRQLVVGVVLQRAAELTQLNQELQAAVQTRDDFLSMAGHELRTPLTSLQLHLQGLMRTARGQESVPAAHVLAKMEQFRKQLGRLERLIAQLLDVSRLSAGRFHLEPEEVHLPALAREVVERLREQVEASGSAVTVEADEMPPGRWDRLRLDQVLTNLLTNALKYGAGRPVHVALRARPEGVECQVRDEGIGIAPEAQARLFGRFERAVSGNHYAGFGLGLWIVREILTAMGGTIALRSAPDQGSTFTVLLPWHSPEAATH